MPLEKFSTFWNSCFVLDVRLVLIHFPFSFFMNSSDAPNLEINSYAVDSVLLSCSFFFTLSAIPVKN